MFLLIANEVFGASYNTCVLDALNRLGHGNAREHGVGAEACLH